MTTTTSNRTPFPRYKTVDAHPSDTPDGYPMFQYIDEDRPDTKIVTVAYTSGYQPRAARLLAAAPELLEIVKRFISANEYGSTPSQMLIDEAKELVDRIYDSAE